jgi:D-3-phosphoglycerate dehydrogenase
LPISSSSTRKRRTRAGCALDVTDPEPLLRNRDNVIITPHVAWYSEQAMGGLQSGAPIEVRRVLTGQWPLNVVNHCREW